MKKSESVFSRIKHLGMERMAKSVARESGLPLSNVRAGLRLPPDSEREAERVSRESVLPVLRDHCIAEYSDGSRVVEGLSFRAGRIVHYENDKTPRPVTLRESILIFASLEGRFLSDLPDGTHDPDARAKWLRMVAAAMR